MLEAAQHSVPSVYFEDASGIGEFVKPNAGLSIPSFDNKEASHILFDIINDAEKRKILGETAKQRVLSDYTADKQCRRIVEILEKRMEMTSLDYR